MIHKGKWIRQILEHSAAKYGTGGWLQVSGIRYTVDLRKPKQVLNGERVLQPGKRVSRIEVLQNGSWKPLEEEKEYRVLSNAFMVQRAGDGYYWFRRYGQNPYNTYTTFYSVMAETLHKTGVLSPPAPDGRITIVR
jgi:5'-nucleotidase